MEANEQNDPPVILVADDEDDVRSLIVTQLTKSGYEVVEATEGAQALELAMERRPDLAILDVMMPGLNGYELTKRLRENVDTEEMPIIILTARAGARDVTQGFEVGADDYIKKPFSPRELRDRVQEILGR
jgi:DNA-binding response OmpR family regulator